MKNASERAGNWKEIKAKLKQKFALLMAKDLLFVDGKKDDLFARLQIRLGKTKEEVQLLLSQF